MNKRKKFMGDWANLPEDLLISIAKRAVSMVDVFAFAAVCKLWRSVATREDFTSLVKHQVPLLLALSDDDTANELYNLTKDKASEVQIPELASGKRYYSSYLGWVMSVSTEDLKVSLFNPLKINSQIELPDINRWQSHFLKKFVLSSSPSWTSDYIVMVLGHSGTLEFCRPGDKQWTSIARDIDTIGEGINLNFNKSIKLDDIAYYRGQFYVVGRYGTIYVCDIEDPQQPILRVVVPKMPGRIRCSGSIIEQIYLVESAGDLLAVSRFFDDVYRVAAFKVPLSNGEWSCSLEVRDLGKRTLFIGSSSTSSSIDTGSNSECRANCMYFTHLSIYDMKDRKFEQVRKIAMTLKQRLWIQPSL